jgi:hypothetical protein
MFLIMIFLKSLGNRQVILDSYLFNFITNSRYHEMKEEIY